MENTTPIFGPVTRGATRVAVVSIAGLSLLELLSRVGIEPKYVFILFCSVLLSAAIAPLVGRIEGPWRPRALAITLVYLVIFSIVGGLLSLLWPLIWHESNALYKLIEPQFANLQGTFEHYLSLYSPGTDEMAVKQTVMEHVKGSMSGVTTALQHLLRALLTIGTGLILVPIIAFFFTLEGHHLKSFFTLFVSHENQQYVEEVVTDAYVRLGKWARVQMLGAFIFGTTFGIVLWMLGLKYALTIAFAGCVLEIIPWVGSITAVSLALLVAANDPHPWMWMAVLATYFSIKPALDHFIQPKLMQSAVGIPAVAIIIAMVYGAERFHVLGVLLAVPTLILIKMAIVEYRKYQERKREAADSAAQTTAVAAPVPAQVSSAAPARNMRDTGILDALGVPIKVPVN